MLNIDTERNGGVVVMKCAGRIVRGQEIQKLKTAVMGQNESRIVVLDLGDVQAIDAGGLNALVSLHQWACARSLQLKLVNPSHFVHEMLTRTKLDRVFDVSSFRRALYVLSGIECGHAKYAASV